MEFKSNLILTQELSRKRVEWVLMQCTTLKDHPERFSDTDYEHIRTLGALALRRLWREMVPLEERSRAWTPFWSETMLAAFITQCRAFLSRPFSLSVETLTSIELWERALKVKPMVVE